MVKVSENFLKISWKKAFLFIKGYFLSNLSFSKSTFIPLRGFVGQHLDIETVYMLKRFFTLNGSSFLFNTGYAKNNSDFSRYYSFNTPLVKLAEADICLLVDVNLRIDLPLLNSRIKQLSVKKMLSVYVIGFYSNYNYFVKHISGNPLSGLSILEGSHWLSSKISKNFLLNR
jgi:NADH dehydrogenase/NADH:ubiquinone oxidoreductase subunit G